MINKLKVHFIYLFEPGAQFFRLNYLLFLTNFQVYIIGGDGTQKGASVIFEVIKVSKLEAVRDLG